MSYESGLKVFAPATVANVAVGYDILGFAIEALGDEVIVKKGDKPGLHITKIIKNKGLSLSLDKNTAGFSAFQLLKKLGLESEPIEMELIKNMDIGTGLGSSASSAVAGVFAVNEYLGSPFDKPGLLTFATQGEQIADGSFHADNVAPSLLGGIVLIRDNETLDCIKLPSPIGLKVIVIHPHIKILTRDSRDILKPDISLNSHIIQSGNLAAFVSGLYRSDFDIINRSLQDVIIEPQRAHLIPYFQEMKEIALRTSVMGFSISGAGPSMFGLCSNSIIAENAIENIKAFLFEKNINADFYISNINQEGAKIY